MVKVDQVKEFKKLLKVESVEDAQRVLNTLSALVISKAIDPKTANTLARIIKLQLRAIELSELEERLNELERRIEQIRRW